MNLLNQTTRNLFFTGKGGVGKTSLACATAVALADKGKRVLLVSTDPASNLDEVLGVTLNNQPTPIPDVPGLAALNINPEAAAKAYRDRVIEPYRGILPEAALASMEEQLSGSCTLEIAAFDEFSQLLADVAATAQFDHVVFDTAPTGHTLRLLSLPSAWTGFIETNTTGTSCLGPLAGLQKQQQLYQDSVKALANADLTTLVMVTRPEQAALREAERSSKELANLGIRNQRLIVNGVFHAQDSSDLVARTLESRGREALQAIPEGIAALPITEIALNPRNLIGIVALRGMFDDAFIPTEEGGQATFAELPELADLVNEIAPSGHGVIFTMGKGGVGKTTVAAAIAVELADRGFPVLLTTTDPAAHVLAAVGHDLPPGLRVSKIDPLAETQAYTAEVLQQAGAKLDVQGKALLEEDLRSPCTEEIAVFRAFARAVDEGRDGFVVLDTAPSGHTILLLDTALAYQRELSRQASELPDAVRDLLPRLRDPDFTRILVVTLPEATPVHEAASLQADLERAGIQPFAWVINQSLTPLTLTDPVLVARQHAERPYIQEVTDELASRVALVPWLSQAPVGVERLRELVTASSAAAGVAH